MFTRRQQTYSRNSRCHILAIACILISCFVFSSQAQDTLSRQPNNIPPTCGNCHIIADIFYECYHKTMLSTEPCDEVVCIENILTTATCDFFPEGDPNRHLCSAKQTNSDEPIAIQNLRLSAGCFTTQLNQLLYGTLYVGCGSCSPILLHTRCNTFSYHCASGILISSAKSPVLRYDCSCPP